MKITDVKVKESALYFLAVETRVPLKFGTETTTHVICARVRMRVEDRGGGSAVGWGETPLSVVWAWPADLPYEKRQEAMLDFCRRLNRSWAGFRFPGHPMEIGYRYLETRLPKLLSRFIAEKGLCMPRLTALICCSAFDIALHDAYGNLQGQPVYSTYNQDYMNADLTRYLQPAARTDVSFKGMYPQDFFRLPPPQRLKAWHLVGGLDRINERDLDGSEPDDGYPVLLSDWVRRDGLVCLKVKLRGNDSEWDYLRLVKVAEVGIENGVQWLTCDFNCTVTNPDYVNDILDKLLEEHPRLYGMILYVEQPFPYDLDENRIDVRSVSARKPLFMDESAHDWRKVRLGRELGWTGVALKTCKTQTGALLSLCWARAHGMTLMVQDLTNPMLAQIPHLLLAAHAGTIMGVETNGMQFYPEASSAEAKVHPGIYTRKNGEVDLSTLGSKGFGYRIEEIRRDLPEPE